VGDPPTAVADPYAFTGRGPFAVAAAQGVLHNDSDPAGATLTAELVAGPTYGTLYLAPEGSFRYAPVTNFSGSDGFTYRATNGTLASTDASVTITVVGPPVATYDAYRFSVSATPALGVAAPGVLANDGDPRNAPPANPWAGLAAQLVPGSGPAHGRLTLDPAGSFAYTPDGGYTGPDAFAYIATDGTLASDPTPVRITVDP
jgi:hypothetical protein